MHGLNVRWRSLSMIWNLSATDLQNRNNTGLLDTGHTATFNACLWGVIKKTKMSEYSVDSAQCKVHIIIETLLLLLTRYRGVLELCGMSKFANFYAKVLHIGRSLEP